DAGSHAREGFPRDSVDDPVHTDTAKADTNLTEQGVRYCASTLLHRTIGATAAVNLSASSWTACQSDTGRPSLSHRADQDSGRLMHANRSPASPALPGSVWVRSCSWITTERGARSVVENGTSARAWALPCSSVFVSSQISFSGFA